LDDIASEVLLIGRTQSDSTICKRSVGELRAALQRAYAAGRDEMARTINVKPDGEEWGVFGAAKGATR
jgi:hypothetical protein